MATNEKNSVIVELYDLPLTEREDDRFGRVVSTKSLNEDDLVNIAVSRRTELNATTLKSAIEILTEIAIEQVANGASVRFGLGYFGLGVSGVFIGDNAKWNPQIHRLWARSTPTSGLNEAIGHCVVDVRGMAAVGVAINSVKDVSSGFENSRLTPGGGVNITGSKIKIAGEHIDVGIKLIEQNAGAEVIVPATSILVNEPSKITFIVPADLPNGDYKLSLTTQFMQSNKTLKEPRTCIFDYVLNVIK